MSKQPEKKEILLNMLEEGLTMLHIDARSDEVLLPTYLKNGDGGFFPGAISLNISYRFGLHDFEVSDQYMEASLSFRGAPFFCRVPLKHIWGMSHPYDESGKIIVFEEDCPKDVYLAIPKHMVLLPEEAQTRWDEKEEFEVQEEKPKKKHPFKVIDGGKLGEQ